MKSKFDQSRGISQLNEVHFLKKIKHPNIVKLLDAFKEGEYLYIIYEFVHTNLLRFYLSH